MTDLNVHGVDYGWKSKQGKQRQLDRDTRRTFEAFIYVLLAGAVILVVIALTVRLQ